MFFSFASITSISYTSVLQRTFNLNIRVADGRDVEFSMLDQAEFAGIDAYIKRHGLHDASMAEERRAKRLKVVGEAEGASENQAWDGAEAGETELEKAQRMLEEAEDEMEVDYEPGSEGDSDGSGSDTDEEEEGRVDGYNEEEDGDGGIS
jgi:hypothetical protein